MDKTAWHGRLAILLFALSLTARAQDENALMLQIQQCLSLNFSGPCCSGGVPFLLGVNDCAPGFYCPLTNASDVATWPQVCPPENWCTLTRLAAFYCPRQGKFEPAPCLPGKVCYTPRTQEDCPAGYYCPRGTFEPRECEPLSYCPPGSDKRLYVGAFLFVGLANLLLLAVSLTYRRLRAAEKRVHRQQMLNVEMTSLVKTTDEMQNPAHNLPKPTRRLVRGFNNAKGPLKHMDFEFKDLSLALPSGQKILSGVNGRLAPGKVTAVMGPSGAGKTSFLYTLMGKVDKRWKKGGDLRINGVETEMSQFKRVVGYVPQEDVMLRELTVWDNISFSAKVRLPPSWTAIEEHTHVRAVVDAMGLGECADVLIGDESERGISGGQRKRVNIGMELAAAPLALFLDEPTSGLDSTAAMDVCRLLKDIAGETGITVAMVIHQPRVEIWNSLDDVLLLAPGGRTVYQGPQRLAQRYFEEHLTVSINKQENPADVIMDAIAEGRDNFARQWLLTGRDLLEKMLRDEQAGVTPIKELKKGETADAEPSEKSTGRVRNRQDSQPEIASQPVTPAMPAPRTLAPSLEQAQSEQAQQQQPQQSDSSKLEELKSPSSQTTAGAGKSEQLTPRGSSLRRKSSNETEPLLPGAIASSAAQPASDAPLPSEAGTLFVRNASDLSGSVFIPRDAEAAPTTPVVGAVVVDMPHANGNSSNNGLNNRATTAATARTANVDLSVLPIAAPAKEPPAQPHVAFVKQSSSSDAKSSGAAVSAPSPPPSEKVILGPSAATNANGSGAVGAAGAARQTTVTARQRQYSIAETLPADKAIKFETRGAPFFKQMFLCHIRSLKQQHEKLAALYLESGVAMFAGFLMGIGGGNDPQAVLINPYAVLSAAPLEWLVPLLSMFVNMAIGLAASSAGVKAFGEERVVYWREAASGHSPLAYFLGNSLAMMYRITLSALHFTFVFHILAKPLITFGELLLLVMGSFYAVYGLAAGMSMVLKRENAPLLAVVASLFAAVFGGYVTNLPEFIKKISYAYWASAAFYDRQMTPFRHIYQVDAVSAPLWGYPLDQYGLDVFIVFAIGTIFRIVAYILMVSLHKDKQT